MTTTQTPKRNRKVTDKPVTDKAAVIEQNTSTATQQVEDFIGSLPVFTMKKKNNEWFASIGREAGKALSSKVGVVRLYNSGHPSVQFVTVEFAKVDGEEMLFTVAGNLLKK